MRIVSLFPGATEMVYALGLGEALVGVSPECDFPPEVRGKRVMVHPLLPASLSSSADIDRWVRERFHQGLPLYEVDRDALMEARPDLILTQDLCRVCAIPTPYLLPSLEGLQPPPRILSLDPNSLEEVLEALLRLGEETGVPRRAQEVVASLRERCRRVEEAVRGVPRPRVVCLEWLDPPMASGHWLPDLVERAGGEEVLGWKGGPSRRVEWEEVLEARPEVLVLAPCGYDVARTLQDLPLLARRPGWEEVPAVRAGRVFACDGSAYFSRPGPRLVDTLEMLAEMLHPGRFSGALGPDRAVAVGRALPSAGP